jgi:hypothetical protein
MALSRKEPMMLTETDETPSNVPVMMEDIDPDIAALDPGDYLTLPDIIQWERMPAETNKSWAGFLYYRDMGPSRTYSAIKAKGGRTFSHTWPDKFYWRQRVQAYDAYIAAIAETEYVEATKEMAKRHAKAAGNALDALMAPINALQLQMEEDPDAVMDHLKATDPKKLISMIQASSRVLQPIMNAERLAQGMPTEVTQATTETQVTVNNADPDRLANLVEALVGTGVLDALVGKGRTGEVVDAPSYEVDSHNPAPEADRLPTGTS